MRFTFTLFLAILFAGSAAAQTSYPMITHVTPVAVQRGKTTQITVEGQMNFFGVYKALFEGEGVTAEFVTPPAQRPAAGSVPMVRSVKLKVIVAENAPLGVREFRVASPLGVSSVGQLVICEHPVILESGDNNTRVKANPIPVPGVVHGRIEVAEDVDYFKFHAEAGQTFSFEVLCARLQDKIHDLQKHADPMLTLVDADGRELAANDDFFFADPYLAYTFTKTGDYFIQVRDSKYDGDARWVYALFVTDKPHVTHVYPMAGNPGKAIEVEPVGSARLTKPRIGLVVPKELGLQTVTLELDSGKTNPVPFIVSELPQVLEQEPNDTPDKATRITIPCGVNGRIDKPRDLDHFVFKAAKGRAIRFEVKARRFGTLLQSSLDSFLDILDAKGTVLASNDDTFGKDAALVFTPTADADYTLRIRDLNSKGGPTAVYYIEADWAQPDFSLRCDPDKAMIAPGIGTAWFVHLTRSNGFTGPVRVEVKGLPKGVSVSPLTIPESMTQGVLVVSAAADAPRDAVNVEIIGTATAKIDGKDTTLTRRVTPNQEIYSPGGGRARFDVNLQTVAVTDLLDILKVTVTPAEVVLKPGREVKLDVTIERRPDYDKGVSLDILLRHLATVYGNPLPPGVTIEASKSKTLLGNGSKGHIVLKAAPDAAPIEGVPICVMAHVSVNFVVKISYASPAIQVSVRK
jgi:Bacterial pre-peptidase C-terminal domain